MSGHWFKHVTIERSLMTANQHLSTVKPRHNHALSTLRVNLPMSPCPALSAYAAPIAIARNDITSSKSDDFFSSH